MFCNAICPLKCQKCLLGQGRKFFARELILSPLLKLWHRPCTQILNINLFMRILCCDSVRVIIITSLTTVPVSFCLHIDFGRARRSDTTYNRLYIMWFLWHCYDANKFCTTDFAENTEAVK